MRKPGTLRNSLEKCSLEIGARIGTTDPVPNLNYLFDHIEFVSISDSSSFKTKLPGSIVPPLIGCKCGDQMALALITNLATR